MFATFHYADVFGTAAIVIVVLGAIGAVGWSR